MIGTSQTDELLNEISGKLDKILRLITIDVTKGIQKVQDKIELLDSLGFRPYEIARFLNKSQDNINVQLGNIRKKREGDSRNRASEKKLVLQEVGTDLTRKPGQREEVAG